MLPILVTIGSFKLYSFGVFFATALFFGLYWWWKLGRDEHLEEVALFDTYFLSVFAFLIIGRIGYVLTHLSDFENIYRMLGIIAFPGLSFLSGVMGAMLVMIVSSYYQEWEIWKILDNLAVSFGIIFLIASVGGLLNGSTPGIPVAWGLQYPGFAEPRLPLDIVQILWAGIYFVVVSHVRKNFRFFAWYRNDRTVAADGLPTLVAMAMGGMLYIIRGLLENSWKVGGVSYYLLGGVMVVLISSVLIYFSSGRTLFKK
ncbi:MAG: prolipoprotein diacylglyceryl transferase family protein [bacterium]